MMPMVLTPLSAKYLTTGGAVVSSLGTIINAQRRMSSTGQTRALIALVARIGVLASPAIGTIASDVGVTASPISTSALFSVMSLRVFAAVWVTSVRLSSTT